MFQCSFTVAKSTLGLVVGVVVGVLVILVVVMVIIIIAVLYKRKSGKLEM